MLSLEQVNCCNQAFALIDLWPPLKEGDCDFATTIWNLGPAVYSDGSLFTALFDLLDHAIQIGIARTKPSREPVPAALCNPLAVSNNLELTSLPRCSDGFDVEALLDEGHETRDLGLVILSGRAVNNLDLHLRSKRFLAFYAVRFAFSNDCRNQPLSFVDPNSCPVD